MYLQEGQHLELFIDVDQFDESIKYLGSGAAENNILAQTYLIEEEKVGDQKEFYSQNEKDFIEAAKKILDTTQSIINSSKLTKNFSEDQIKNAEYNYALLLIKFENYHRFYTKNDSFLVSMQFKDAQIDFSIDDEYSYRNSKAYSSLVKTVFDQKVNSNIDSNTSYKESIFKTSESWEKGYIKNEILNGKARYIISPDEELEMTYQSLMKEVTDSIYQIAYTEQYNKMLKLMKGKASPTFVDYENHAGGTTSFEDLKGKYTYIDVWATWCGPCIREIPALKKLEADYQGKNIQFVSISIDTEKAYETWVNMVNEKELGGIQLIAENAWQSKFTRAYSINSIPRFILIDPLGNIVSADANRPSNQKLRDLFEELGI
jgi:thiol-disulfide isomerase/thioredoxin